MNGSVGGRSIEYVDSYSNIARANEFNALEVFIGDVSDVCSTIQRGALKSSSSALVLILQSAGAIVPGTYDVGSASQNIVLSSTFVSFDETCGLTSEDKSIGGSLTIDEVTSDAVKGSFLLTFGGGGSLSGTFDAPRCSATILASSDGPDVCEAP